MPDRVNAKPLRCYHFPFQVVADHPRLVRLDAEDRQSVAVGAFFGFAETVFAFDLDVVEAVGQLKALDLGALRLRGTVGDQRQFDTRVAQRIDDLMCVRE